jgi:hypothetical protein
MTTSLPPVLGRNAVTRTLLDRHFLGGLAVGAVVTLVLGNRDVQQALFRGIARVATAARSGVEEVKERFHDAEAEVAMEATDAAEEEGAAD